jgi:formylglycine-generating enzyme required for sulfatase activity
LRDGLVATALKSVLLLLVATLTLAQTAKKPLSVGDVERLLKGGVTTARVATLVGRVGVDFEMTGATRARLESAGADADLIAAIERAAAATAAEGSGATDGMVLVPGGSFFMGCNESVDGECDPDEKPGRNVDVAAFRIDKTEVTVEDYRKCVNSGRCSSPGEGQYCNWGKSGRDRHPINCVSWDQAVAYCEWRGKRLPTEAEWEKAARGMDRRKYPWGNAGYGAAGRVANIADESAKRVFADWTTAEGYDDGNVETAPVGSYPAGASPYGALDMVGNVWEWTSDWYPGKVGEARVVRGGSWDYPPQSARASLRNRLRAGARNRSLGFRCAR